MPSAKFVTGDLVIDYETRRVFIADVEVKLTQTEYNILVFLSERAGKMMTYATIIKAVWGGYVDDGSVQLFRRVCYDAYKRHRCRNHY